MKQFIDTTSLSQWFDSARRDAQEQLPLLLRYLILETVPHDQLARLRAPAGDDVRLPGYDLIVENHGSHLFVPEGHSVWEVGTAATKRKATEDLEKRTAKPGAVNKGEVSFVLVSPHVIAGKEEWREEKQKYDDWREVIYFDAVDLCTWLDTAPATARWIAGAMGVPVTGLRDLTTYWREELNARYGTEIPSDLVIAGREDACSHVQGIFRKNTEDGQVIGESAAESVMFTAAAIRSLPEPEVSQIGSRVIFLDAIDAVDFVAGSLSTIHYAIPTTEEVYRRAKAVQAQNLRILHPMAGGNERSPRTERKKVTLGNIQREACEKQLVELGLPPREADQVARESKGSLAALLWMVGEANDQALPWLSAEAAHELVPVLLAGQWAVESKADCEIVAQLAEQSYVDIERTVARWSAPEGPLMRRGSNWDWLAWPFAWRRLAPKIETRHVTRFQEACEAVFGVPDPSLELAPDERWAAAVYGKTHPYSEALRSGLSGSLAQLATNHELVQSIDARAAVAGIVRRLLNGALVSKPKAWPTLSRWLPDFAEASPDEFLALVQSLAGDHGAIEAMFVEGDTPFTSSPHVNLLWAIERVAWSAEYFTAAVLRLGDLAAVDPGGNLQNRPLNSLREILLPWHPQTTAAVEDRVGALRTLFQYHPDVAWELAVSLLPGATTIASGTAEPQWRDWKVPGSERVTRQEYHECVNQLVDLLLQWAPMKGSRWQAVVGAYGNLRRHPELGGKLLSALQAVDPDTLAAEDRKNLAEKIRQLIARHREVPEADWAMTEQELEPFDEMYERLKPATPSERYTWLFSSWPDLHRHGDMSFDERMELVRGQRAEAVEEIIGSEGLAGIFAMAERVERPDTVGIALAESDHAEHSTREVLSKAMGIQPERKRIPPTLEFGLGFVRGALEHFGDAWADQVVNRSDLEWDAVRYANLAWGLPASSSTWDRLEKWSSDGSALYWRRIPIDRVDHCESDAERAIRNLLNAQRPYRAILVGEMCIRRSGGRRSEEATAPFSEDLVVEMLHAAPSQVPDDEWYPPSVSLVRHAVEDLLEILDKRGTEMKTMIRLEWKWMVVLENSRRGLRTLQGALSEDPELFVELLKLAYRGDNDEPQDLSEQDRIRAEQAFRLLENWRIVPGTETEPSITEEEDGEPVISGGAVNARKLASWIENARSLANDVGRITMCDLQIGDVFAYSPEDSDGSWPCEAVRHVIEHTASEDLDRGFEIGIYNRRGAHFRSKGGGQERRLAKKFRDYASQIKDESVRTAAALRRVAERYEYEAKWHDERDELAEFE